MRGTKLERKGAHDKRGVQKIIPHHFFNRWQFQLCISDRLSYGFSTSSLVLNTFQLIGGKSVPSHLTIDSVKILTESNLIACFASIRPKNENRKGKYDIRLYALDKFSQQNWACSLSTNNG
jgi:hypothetical protein